MDSVLDFLDDNAKSAAFEDNFTKLAGVKRIDLDVLRLCVQLLSPPTKEDKAGTELRHERLWNLIASHVCGVEQDSEHLYALADIYLRNAYFAAYIAQRIYETLDESIVTLTTKIPGEVEEEQAHKAVPFLRFLTCSFWLPKDRYHLITPISVTLLLDFIGVSSTDSTAHDALSALLSLLKNGGPISTCAPELWPQFAVESKQIHPKHILDCPIWTRLAALEPEHFTTSASKVFRTWFQWISLLVANNIEVSCLYDNDYWDKLRLGLLHGFADQRKYCLGILRQSLLAARENISTPTLWYYVDDRELYLEEYRNFANIFEMIVLNRYAKQVEACLPQLLVLLGPGAIVSPVMATTLLSSALNSKIQEGIRKMVGNWCVKHIIYGQLIFNTDVHFQFLLEGLLPWAVDGSLFTSTLTSTRETTESAHGVAIVDLVIKFMSRTLRLEPPITLRDPTVPDFIVPNPLRRTLSLGIIRFISDSGGRIFQPAILYLMEGLIKSAQACPEKFPLQGCLTLSEVVDIISLSRLTGLPEIMSDLFSLYCARLCEMTSPDWKSVNLPGCAALQARVEKLESSVDENELLGVSERCDDHVRWLQVFLKQLRESRHKSIQGATYAPACCSLISALDNSEPASIDQNDLYDVLEAMWEEAERREFIRPVAINLPSLLFHPTCVRVCILQYKESDETSEKSLSNLLTTAIQRLQRLSAGRLYLVSRLAKSIRKAVITDVRIVNILPIEDFIVEFINNPPTIKSEFLFEVAAAERLVEIVPHRTFASYYGEREWHAYAAVIDLLQRFPEEGLDACKRILDRLLEPWKMQRAPGPVKSPWKQTLQLQAMLILSDFAINESDLDTYLDAFMHALVLEPWPRFRYLLEWILARIYRRCADGASRIFNDVENVDPFSPVHIASLMKLGLLIAPFNSEKFTINLATKLTSFCTSPKVQIRHEANFTFPPLFDLAEQKGWKGLIDNPALKELNAFIRRLDKFNSAPWTIRTLRLDIEKDFTIVNIFQGAYLSIESPEPERVTFDDFVALPTERDVTNLPLSRIPLGSPETTQSITQDLPIGSEPQPTPEASLTSAQTFLQTKAGFDLDSLHPPTGPLSQQNQRPASVILIASLIDNPTNLGGLSRISESFGLEALYINDLKKMAHKDFKATSVTSEKHFPIHELREVDVPHYLLEAKRDGYEVVGIEQTDRSVVLGQDGQETLPRKCVLVLGSEKEGISAEVLAVVDRCVEIRTVGVTRSLNVQTAGGIAVFEWWRVWGGRKG